MAFVRKVTRFAGQLWRFAAAVWTGEVSIDEFNSIHAKNFVIDPEL